MNNALEEHLVALLPPDLEQLLTAHFGAPPADLAPTFGGFSNLTVRATLGGAPCIIKAATTAAKRADVRHEARLLPALRAAGLPTATYMTLIEDVTWTSSITAALPGANGLHVLSEASAALPFVFSALGSTLAAVHATPPPTMASDMELTPRRLKAHAMLAGLPAPPDLVARLQTALEHPIWECEARLIHGDSGLHNVLWGPEGLWLLDWEWAACGPALLDLAWVRWTIAWRKLPMTLWEAFLSGYGPLPAPLDPVTQAHLALGQIGLILARVAEQPVARAEWVRRAVWTETIAG
jgi:aminoglycoside phosphotransferase (APT) family kinase protein